MEIRFEEYINSNFAVLQKKTGYSHISAHTNLSMFFFLKIIFSTIEVLKAIIIAKYRCANIQRNLMISTLTTSLWVKIFVLKNENTFGHLQLVLEK